MSYINTHSRKGPVGTETCWPLGFDCPTSILTVEKAQSELRQWGPWVLTGVTIPFVRQSTVSGRARKASESSFSKVAEAAPTSSDRLNLRAVEVTSLMSCLKVKNKINLNVCLKVLAESLKTFSYFTYKLFIN